MTYSNPQYQIQSYATLPSTNKKLKELLIQSEIDEFTVIITDDQTSGRGQQNNTWESKKGQNLTFSILLKPTFLEPDKQFYISKVVTLAIIDFLQEHTPHSCIKWPNDIYVNDKKIAGVLIENTLMGNGIATSIIGIGLNINQKDFISDAPNPVSLYQLTKKEHNINDMLYKFLELFQKRYQLLVDDKKNIINNDYFYMLYRKDGYHLFKDVSGEFDACIESIDESGLLRLKDTSGIKREYAFKEVEFVIK